MGQISCILFDGHVRRKGGGRDTESDPSHAIVSQRLARSGSPDKAMEVPVSLGELDCSINLTDVRDESYTVKSESEQDIK